MPSSAKKRSRAATRSRTALPRKRRANNSHVFARRGMIALGIIVAASLIVALVGTVASDNGASTPVPAPQSEARARVSLGESLFSSGDLQGAQSQFVQAITFASAATDQQTVARAHLDLGDVYTVVTPPRPNDALTEYQQAANLDPSGAVGDQARQKLALLQQQSVQPAVTVIVPSVPSVRPTGTP